MIDLHKVEMVVVAPVLHYILGERLGVLLSPNKSASVSTYDD